MYHTADYPAAQALIASWVQTYNHTRLHSALNYLTPAQHYRGDPEAWVAERHANLRAEQQTRKAAWEAFHGAALSAGE